jgi:hypothetical protein
MLRLGIHETNEDDPITTNHIYFYIYIDTHIFCLGSRPVLPFAAVLVRDHSHCDIYIYISCCVARISYVAYNKCTSYVIREFRTGRIRCRG